MTLREKLHARIDELPETELERLTRHLDLLERRRSGDETDERAKTIALWEELAEPVDDPEARAALAEAVERRPFFRKRGVSVEPD